MKRKWIYGLVGLLVLGGVVFGFWYFKSNNKVKATEDEIKFKEEYEKLNNTNRESDGVKYNNIDVPEHNLMKYVNAKEMLDVLKMDKALIYVGAGWCPWCRNAVPVLIDVAKKNNIETIYYLNLDNEKSSWGVKDGKLVQTKKGSDAYYQLLDALKEHLRDYIITDKGKEYDTKEKRIYMPFVIAVNSGVVVSKHNGTVDLNENQNKYSYLTEEQKSELEKIYQDMIDDMNTVEYGTCSDSGDCN